MGPSAKTTKFMTIEIQLVKKKTTMGKLTTDLPVWSLGQEVSHARNPIVAVTPEAANVTHREKEVCLSTQPRNSEVPNRIAGVFIERIVEDWDEDGGEGSNLPTRSFFRI
ncbi:hypothetical protein ACFXTI_037811 [Malus domestica]